MPCQFPVRRQASKSGRDLRIPEEEESQDACAIPTVDRVDGE